MAYDPPNPNGQATSANSAPVVIASDQSTIPTQAQGNVASGATDSGNPVKVGGRYNSTPPTLTNGQRGDLQLDASGNLKVSSSSGTLSQNLTQVSGSTISLGQTTMSASLPVTLASNDTNTAPFVTAGGGGYVRQDSTGTIAKETGGNLATIATNTTGLATATGLSTLQTTLNTVNTNIGTTNTNTANTATNTSTIAGAISSGKMNVNLSSGALPSGSNTIGNVELTDGTNTANVAANNSATTGNAGNFVLSGGTGYTTGTITLNAGSPSSNWYDMLNYPMLSLEILTNASANALNFQTSGDASETNVRSMVLQDSQNTSYSGFTNINGANNTLFGARTGRYFRVNSTLSGGNTATITITFYTSGILGSVGSNGSVSLNSVTGATGSSTPSNAVLMGITDGTNMRAPVQVSVASGTTGTGLLGAGILGQYNSSAPTVTSGNYNVLQLDSNANTMTSLGTLISGEDLTNNVLRVELHYTNFNINSATTTTVKSGAGYVDEIIAVGGTLGNVTIYDNTSASGTVLLPTVTPVANGYLIKHVTFSTGLTIVTAAATVITGSYR